MVDLAGLVWAAAAGAVAVAAFGDAPARLARAHREGRVLADGVYHAANAASVLVLAAWAAALALGLDRSLGVADPRLRWLGVLAALPGFGLAAWARVALGPAFAPTAAVPPDGRVVEEGPYARVRHPFYVGLVVALAGGALALDSGVTVACLVVLAPLVRAVAVREERQLVAELGEAYEDYRARVPRWVPRAGG